MSIGRWGVIAAVDESRCGGGCVARPWGARQGRRRSCSGASGGARSGWGVCRGGG